MQANEPTQNPIGQRLILGALALLALLGTALPAQAQVGGAAVVFLMIEPDSRAAGMGNAGVAVADNAYAVYWNPAGLAYQEGTELALTHSKWLPEFDAGLYYENLVGRYHVDGLGTFAGQVTFLNLGSNEWRDGQNQVLGTFRSYDLAVGASYATNLSDNFALGTGVRLIYSNLAPGVSVEGQETKAGVSAGFDLAALYRSNDFGMGGMKGQLSAGFNLANMGPKIQYSDGEQKDPIPTTMRFGYAFTMKFDEYNKLTLANDFSKMLIRSDSAGNDDPFYKAIFSSWQPIRVRTNAQADQNAEYKSLSVLNQLMVGLGAEYWYRDLFALRSGYFYENPYNGNRKFLTFGAGVRYNIVGVDFSYIYALEEDHPLANTMRFSLLLNFAK